MKSLASGLFISGTPSAAAPGLAITGIGGVLFKVEDGGKFLGNYRIPNLYLTLANYSQPITIDLEGQRIGGNVVIQRGNGNLGAANTNPLQITDGSVGGSITAVGGRGNETLALGDPAIADKLTVGGNVTVAGRNGAIGDGDDFLLRTGSRVGGNLTLSGTAAVALGVASGTGASVGGNLSVSAVGLNRELGVTLLGTTTIGKSVAITGTNIFTVGGDSVAVDTDVVVNGNFTANLANNVNFWLLAGTYGGNVSLVGGSGGLVGVPSNLVQLDDGAGNGAVIAGSLNLTMGNSDFALIFADGATVAGDLNATIGNGTNDLGGGTFGGTFAGDVDGNITLRLGNGDNFFNFDGPTASVGGRLSYFGGSGVDTVELGGSIAQLAVFLGVGDDFLTLDVGTAIGSAVIDLGPGSDTYTDNGATFGTLLFMDSV